MTQLFKLFGLTAPFVCAGPVYALFLFLERNASPAARRTVSDWLKGEPYTKEHVSNITVYVFDRVYTYPLLRWRPLARTAIISAVLMVIIVYTNMPALWLLIQIRPEELGPHFGFWLLKNIISDYCSLFVVRQWLLMGAKRPLLALTTGPIVGAFVVCVVYLILDVTRYSLFVSGTFEWIYFWQDVQQYRDYFFSRPRPTANAIVTIPAFLIHLWLPLFAAGVVFTQGLNSLRLATSWAQWFLKNGSRRPFHAIGIVAATLTFVCVALFRFFSAS
jgi:hypothetical protein